MYILTIREDLSKKYLWRVPRIRRITQNILSGHARLMSVRTIPINTELKKPGSTYIDVMPYYMAEYIDNTYNVEDPYKRRWAQFGTGFEFRWGFPTKETTRIRGLIRYPSKYEEEGSNKVYNKVLDAIRLDNLGKVRKYVVTVRAHIEISDESRLVLPPRFVLRDVKRAFSVIEKEGKLK